MAASAASSGPPIHTPCSADIVGPRLAVVSAVVGRSACRACAGAHYHFECPVRYARLGVPCPGFDAAGARVASAWANGDLKPATCAAWKAYIARFALRVHMVAGSVPSF